VLSEYLGNSSSGRDVSLVYGGSPAAEAESSGLLAQKLKQALQKKK
jgi:hypothetical protein